MIATLLESHELAPEVRHFTFAAGEAAVLDFVPGQFVSFSDQVSGRKVTRAYSIASAPRGNQFDLCLNRVREGLFSPHLFALQPGGSVEMRGPLGYFVPRSPFRDAVFVATGTGIAPFRAFLQSPAVRDSGASITLLMGARHESGLLYRHEFEDLAAANPRFQYLPTLTRPEERWQGRTGRVQAHLDEALARRAAIDVYICGLKAMVDDVRAILKGKGFAKQQIIFEKYD